MLGFFSSLMSALKRLGITVDASKNVTLEGNVNMTAGKWLNFLTYIFLQSGGGQHAYIDVGGVFHIRDQDNSNAVRFELDSATGDVTMYGDLDMNGNDITNVGDSIYDDILKSEDGAVLVNEDGEVLVTG